MWCHNRDEEIILPRHWRWQQLHWWLDLSRSHSQYRRASSCAARMHTILNAQLTISAVKVYGTLLEVAVPWCLALQCRLATWFWWDRWGVWPFRRHSFPWSFGTAQDVPHGKQACRQVSDQSILVWLVQDNRIEPTYLHTPHRAYFREFSLQTLRQLDRFFPPPSWTRAIGNSGPMTCQTIPIQAWGKQHALFS